MSQYNGEEISDSEWYAAEDQDEDEYDGDEILRPCEDCGIVLTWYGYQCWECREDEHDYD